MRTIPTSAVALLVLACGGADTGEYRASEAGAVSEDERHGGTAVVALAVKPATFNGLAAIDGDAMGIHQGLLSMPLVRYNEDLEPVPWLAERWDTVRVAPDTLELTFHLRRDVRWHDGVPTTAEDVRFTWERMHDPRVAFPRKGFIAHWSPEVEVPDSFTVRFRLRPHADFLEFWTWDVPLPAHILRDVPPEELRNHPFAQQPMGNGPFRFVRRGPGQQLVFEANPDFPAGLGGRPYLDRVVFRVMPDATARVTELFTGGVQLGFLPPGPAERADQAAGIRLLAYPGQWWTQIAWNTRRAPFDDVRVRRALSLAIDREALLSTMLRGYGEPGRWTVTPSHWQFDPDDPETAPRHDPERARSLLTEAGWRDRDHDGILENAEGRRFRFTLLSFRESTTHPQTAVAVQNHLRQIGVDMQVRLLEEATAFSMVEGRMGEDSMRVRDFDAFLTNYTTGSRADDSWFLHSSNRDAPLSLPGYATPRADFLMDTLAVTLDRDVARPMWREYQRFMMREAPVTVLMYPWTLLGVDASLQGVEAGPARHVFLSAPQWWIRR